MKKILFSLVASMVLVGTMNAVTLDKSTAKAEFIAYKLANKVAVPGSFKDVEFTFAKTDGALVDILSGANAKVDFNKIDTVRNPVRDNNIKTKLVKFMKTPNISVTFKKVTGDDTKGEIVADINMNEVTKEVPMTYEVKDGMIKAMGEIKFTDFMPEAYDNFRNDKVIQALHGKKTHDEVNIVFEAAVK